MHMLTRLSAALLVAGCAQLPNPSLTGNARGTGPNPQAVSADAVHAHMAFLADDLLEGREAGTRGEAVSALYIATQFLGAGVAPGADDGGYLQPFDVRATTLDVDSVDLRIITPTGGRRYPLGEDYAVYADARTADHVVDADIVFAGAGVVAPELGIDDYAGLDVEGRIVAVMGGPPPYLSPVAAAHYGSTDVRAASAEAHGAAGLIIVWTPALEARWSFDRFQSILDRTELSWTNGDAQTTPGAGFARLGWVRGAARAALFEGAPQQFDALYEAYQTASPPGFALESRISFRRRSHHRDGDVALNVIGLVAGSDPALAGETVLLSAHYDHLGIGEPVNGDAIYNGAGDNALGAAALIEMARIVAAMDPPPARTIVFAAVSAEEKGLIGSDYLAEFPPDAIGEIVANINIDGAIPYYQFSDIIAFGAEHSQLCERLTDALAPMGYALASDPFPQQGMFARSDQYSFARRGAPAAFMFTGFTDENGDNVGRALWDHLTATQGHTPSDDMSQPWDFDVVARFADVVFNFALATANHRERPHWYADSSVSTLFAPGADYAERPASPPAACAAPEAD